MAARRRRTAQEVADVAGYWMRRVGVLGLVLLIPAAAACSLFSGEGSVPPDELERKVSEVLADQAGVAPERVDCPEPLPAPAGSTVRCTLSDGGETLGVTVISEGVDGDVVTFGVRVDGLTPTTRPR